MLVDRIAAGSMASSYENISKLKLTLPCDNRYVKAFKLLYLLRGPFCKSREQYYYTKLLLHLNKIYIFSSLFSRKYRSESDFRAIGGIPTSRPDSRAQGIPMSALRQANSRASIAGKSKKKTTSTK